MHFMFSRKNSGRQRVAYCCKRVTPYDDPGMTTQIWVNIGSGNGVLPDDTKPLPEPMLTYH